MLELTKPLVTEGLHLLLLCEVVCGRRKDTGLRTGLVQDSPTTIYQVHHDDFSSASGSPRLSEGDHWVSALAISAASNALPPVLNVTCLNSDFC